ncbi:PfkB family carbohydrate kinase, partial [Eggerthella sinensis]|uniref:PfkB family carbohydrate kinase n=1 Tax=Eggerthella sinensis TaxID=242230 RepID=UPI0022E8268D
MVDMVCQVARLPLSGEGVVVDESHAVVGGCAFNAANVVRQLGAPHELFAPVGVGIFAGFVERELDARGLRAPHFDTRDTGGCVCFVEPSGERTMVTLPGIERHFEEAWFERVDASRFGCGFVSGYEVEGAGGDAIIGFFEAHPSIEFFYAPGPRIVGVGPAKTSRINALHPVWHLNDQEALAYTGRATLDEAGAAIAEQCGNAVVVTA